MKLEEPKQPEPAEENKPKELHTQSFEEHMIEKNTTNRYQRCYWQRA